MRVKAIYRKCDINPFSDDINPSDLIREKVADIEREMELEQLEELAREMTPEGYKFIYVAKI